MGSNNSGEFRAWDVEPKVVVYVQTPNDLGDGSDPVEAPLAIMQQGALGGNLLDNVVSVNTGITNSNSFLYGFDGLTWDRLRSDGNDADNLAVSSLGILNTNNFLYGFDGTNWDRLRSGLPSIDSQGLTNTSLRTLAVQQLFNGSTLDRERGNTNETLLASASRTASINSADFVNYNAKGAHFIIDISGTSASPEITVTIQGKDPISGNYYDLLIGPVYNSVGTNILKVYPGIVASPNASASDILPRDYRVSVANADADAIIYSISAQLVL